MTDPPKRTVQRTARLGSIPVGFAGRAAAGWARWAAGGDRDQLAEELSARNAERSSPCSASSRAAR